MVKTRKEKHDQGRPRKTDGGNRVQHLREKWRIASKKYYEANKNKRKSSKKSKK